MSEPKVYFDACCFIDMAQKAHGLTINPSRDAHIFALKAFLKAARAKDAVVFTSTLTMVECTCVTDLSQMEPNQKVYNSEVQRLFRGMLQSGTSGVTPVASTPSITEAARDLRWQHDIGVKAMDALHLATARKMGCTHFLTTDGRIGAETREKLAKLGLIVCTADAVASSILPSKYMQIELHTKLNVVKSAKQAAAERPAG